MSKEYVNRYPFTVSHEYKILLSKAKPLGLTKHFEVNLNSVQEALTKKLISSLWVKQNFFGFLREEVGSLPILHANVNCETFMVVKASFFKKVKAPFVLTKETVSFETLPVDFLQCYACNALGVPGIVSAFLKDVINFNEIFDTVISNDEDVVNFSARTFQALNSFLAASDYRFLIQEPLNIFRSTGTSFQLDETAKFLHSFYFEVIAPLNVKAAGFKKEITELWLSSLSTNFIDLVKEDMSFFLSFDETPVLASFIFEDAFVPNIVTTNSYQSADKKIYDEIQTLFMKLFLKSNSSTNFSGSDYFTIDTFISCLIAPFTVNVSENKREYLVMMPRSVYDYLLNFFGKLRNVSSYTQYSRVVNVSSVVVGDVTPDVIENFVGLWNYQNDASFISMWEVAKTV